MTDLDNAPLDADLYLDGPTPSDEVEVDASEPAAGTDRPDPSGTPEQPVDMLRAYERAAADAVLGWKNPKPTADEIEQLAAALETGEASADEVLRLIARNRTEPRTWTGKKNICIVGYTATRQAAMQLPREGDDAFEVWGMNNLHLHMPTLAADVWFDLHPTEAIVAVHPAGHPAAGQFKDPQHIAWLESGGRMPVFVQQPRPEWPGAIRFPAQELLSRPENCRYFTNTVAWQIGLAIAQLVGVPGARIAIVGVDMAQGTEYAKQRPSCEFYIGMALALGIDIEIPQASDLLKCAEAYGFESNPMAAKMRDQLEQLGVQRMQAQQRLAQLEQERAEAASQLHQIVGGEAQLNYFTNVWMQPINPDRDAPSGPPAVLPDGTP